MQVFDMLILGLRFLIGHVKLINYTPVNAHYGVTIYFPIPEIS